MNLTSFLNANRHTLVEGHCQQIPRQSETLIQLTNKPNINVMEIGFNGGHSADTFLRNNSTLTLTSFDLGCHNYVATGKKYIDMVYPNRHTLILGDSRTTVPAFIDKNKDVKFDLIFVDGGHCYDVAIADLENCSRLAHSDTIVIIDDTVFTPGWEKPYTIGPSRAWSEFLRNKRVVELGRVDYEVGRGMCWGKYVL